MIDFESIQLHTARILRDFPQLRTVDKREEVLELVRMDVPGAKFSTVERCCRKIQNQLGRYRPSADDKRDQYKNEYKEFFK